MKEDLNNLAATGDQLARPMVKLTTLAAKQLFVIGSKLKERLDLDDNDNDNDNDNSDSDEDESELFEVCTKSAQRMTEYLGKLEHLLDSNTVFFSVYVNRTLFRYLREVVAILHQRVSYDPEGVVSGIWQKVNKIQSLIQVHNA